MLGAEHSPARVAAAMNAYSTGARLRRLMMAYATLQGTLDRPRVREHLPRYSALHLDSGTSARTRLAPPLRHSARAWARAFWTSVRRFFS